MKKLNLITYASVLAKQDVSVITETHRELIGALSEHFDVNVIMHQELSSLDNDGANIVFIATGGTEGMVVSEYDHLPHPLVLLTDGKANSLAASLELSNWVRNQGDRCSIIHGSMSSIVNQVKELLATDKGSSNGILCGTRIGVIGEASDWLVASSVDYAAAKEKWGTEYVDIPLSIVENYYSEITSDEARLVADTFMQKAIGCKEPNEEEIIKASRLYLAIERVVNENNLDALTLQCFSLIGTTCTTGCLALALLNDEGIIAGCEGDMQSVFTMLLVNRLTGKDTFMANPAFIDNDNNEVIFAHCTIGLHQTKQYIIRSHFESQSGVAIQGILPEGDITIVKIGGKNLDEYVALEGSIVENQDDPRKCRTQIRIKLNSESSPASYFLTRSIGNHHIIVAGHHANAISECMSRS